MSKDAFSERGQALEDEFFRRVDKRLLAELKAKDALQSDRKQLQEATGITNPDLLDELLAAGASAESIAAISLVPLVLVAWADGNVAPEERSPIIEAAKEKGITSDSPAAALLEQWLSVKPSRKLITTWQHYIAAVMDQMSVETQAALRSDLIGRAQAVANAAGGVLGFGKVSADEKRVLNELEQTLAR
ncbi:hypothetical protein Pla52o_39940 [Novipirellula galeiformis]|uniref:Co-chaperone DjlA N-terminal domain-containing protein n=2 Tax=Novipirellula galeiformis TaxID=2528004 RepID=A0A5C6C9Z9_9BACT|nr:hypothetical protein Pla52o_39940 [Novipirellula galeiformis]